MRVDLLCSGSKGNSCLVRTKNTSVLIDCGSTKKYLMSSLEASKCRLNTLDGVLITHAHKDHISQLKHFSHLSTYSYCELEDVKNHTHIVPRQEFDIQDVHIQAIGLSHDSPNTVGFVLYAEGEKLVYITDTGFIANENMSLLENADTYIFESNHDVETLLKTSRPMFLKQRILSDSGHLNNEDSSRYLSSLVNSKTKNIVLAHISEEANTPDLALDTIRNCFNRKDMPIRSLNIRAAKQFDRLIIDKNGTL